ncbi:MAG TPA: class I poly(R)-hydroxyalkanoic acid synthase, partial [Stellaceae bacterium]|nr:class I poly(R)-hydroxyalkanoic acid synthase [Stellaceae bacterium]
MVAEFLARQGEDEAVGPANPMAIGAAFFEMTARLMADPKKLIEAQAALWNDYLRLWEQTAQRLLGHPAEPVAEPAPED